MSKNQIVGKSGSHQSSLVQINLMRQMVDSMSNHEERIANLEDTMGISYAKASILSGNQAHMKGGMLHNYRLFLERFG